MGLLHLRALGALHTSTIRADAKAELLLQERLSIIGSPMASGDAPGCGHAAP